MVKDDAVRGVAGSGGEEEEALVIVIGAVVVIGAIVVRDITMLTLLLPLFLFILIGKKRRCYGAERKVGSQGYDPSGK